ncbi:SusC/RagA family TonB-linked outer membrane protein [Neolewinella antarctica]|uniref:TonB-linked SusC/RagA family outer membrane protein n=1 Tax=Neolewinella antarctica TaxID=442734 RepID=A0ABX0X7Z9_9BACT|nr:SusC/RagA family TonB-linked outer membrane protein [Neolewinella antarctica]NJC25345.1 TonB-linked SusC/RagA family outer membrane protein [Neolewinella antarctica]
MMKQLHFSYILILFLLMTGQTLSAQFTAQGTIVDEEGITIIGASVLVKGSSSGTVTDFDGNFVVNIPTNKATLIISYTGYSTQQVPVSAAKPTVNIIITSSSQLLQEVVVTGYGETDLNTFSGAATKVSTDIVAPAARSNFAESLEGNVAGLQVSQGSGQPGAFQDVQIRGLGSINASSNPLYVIDGIPIFTGNVGDVSTTSSPLAGINPQDIEDIQVLKDASATSIYGSRGANGVIVITTKRGKAGKAKISANVQTGYSDVSLDDKLKPLTGNEYVELFTEGLVNRSDFTEAEAIARIEQSYDLEQNTDWFEEVTQRGRFTNANLSASGGSDDLRYFLSAGYQDNEGTILGSEFQRYSSRLNLGTDLSDLITINLNASASLTEQKTVPTGGTFANPVRAVFRLVPLLPIRNEDGSFDQSYNLGYNPVAEAELNKRQSNILNLLGTLSATVKIPFVDGLTFEPFLSYNSVQGTDEVFLPPTSGAGNPLGQGIADNDTQNNWLVRNSLKYKTRFNDAHGVDIILGMEAQEFTRINIEATAENFAFANLTTLNNGADPTFIGGERTANSLVGYFFNGNYNYKGLVYANGTYRRDGSSRFGSDNRYANFFSFGVGINLDRFDFLASSNVITQLRLRTSYGQNGNQAGIDDFASRGLYNTGNDYQGNPGTLLTQLENPTLSWEVNKPFNIGLDVGLFDRINMVVDVYSRRTSSLLFEQPISRTNGVEDINANIGELENRGVEFTLNTQNITSNTNGFTWSTSFNFTTNVNEVIALPDGDFADGQRFRRVGQPWNTWFLNGYDNVNPENGRPQWFVDGDKTEITETYNDSEPYEQGTSDPDFFGGMRNTIGFRGFSLTAQLNYRWGQKIYHRWHSFTHTDGSRGLGSTGNVARSVYDRRWQNPGDITDTPEFVVSRNFGGRNASTRFLYDGSYVSLRDVILDYTFASDLLRKVKFGSVRIFAQASNLYIYTKDDRLERDPRTDVSGIIDQEIPIPQTITFGLDATF